MKITLRQAYRQALELYGLDLENAAQTYEQRASEATDAQLQAEHIQTAGHNRQLAEWLSELKNHEPIDLSLPSMSISPEAYLANLERTPPRGNTNLSWRDRVDDDQRRRRSFRQYDVQSNQQS